MLARAVVVSSLLRAPRAPAAARLAAAPRALWAWSPAASASPAAPAALPLALAAALPPVPVRQLAKKAKKQAKQASAEPAPELDEDKLAGEMDAAVTWLAGQLSALRSGRVDAGLLSNVRVEAYGDHVTLPEVATVAPKDGRLLTVTCFDPALTKAAADAVREAGLGLSPTVNGHVVHVPLPKMTAERRRELARTAHSHGEAAATRVRNVRQKYRKKVKSWDLPEDEHRELDGVVQSFTDSAVKRVEEAVEAKVEAIMESSGDDE